MKNKQIYKNLLYLILALTIIALLAFISSRYFFRVDLTSEKRYTLSESTKNILDTIPEVAYIKIYLDGDLPVGFERLKDASEEILNEFKVHAGEYLQYEFINPHEENDPEVRERIFNELYEKGLNPTNIRVKETEGGTSQKIIFPGALVVYNGIEFPVDLLNNNPGLSAEVNLNNSIQGLEYKFINAIRNLSITNYEKIAFIEGHGELNDYEVGDVTRALASYYQVDRGVINGRVGSLDNYKAVIVAKPSLPFPEEDKFVLDQYLMNGGKILWLLDGVKVNRDSLQHGNTLAFINNLNLDDQLFKYGVRINPNLIMDIQSALIPVNTALAGNKPNFAPSPWWYYPLLNTNDAHPVSRNINLVKAEYASSLDTLGGAKNYIKKTFLLASSRLTKIQQVPAFISLSQVKDQPSQKEFAHSFIPVGVLLEGKFESVFTNRILDGFDIKGEYLFKERSSNTKMILIADGDMIKNDVRMTPNGPAITPLGYDRFSNQTFGNKDFILNAVNYLTDETGIMSLRSREFKLRLLDRQKIRDEKLKWQLINVVLPILLVVIFGFIITFIRKRKYT